jgi:hypothetical protein
MSCSPTAILPILPLGRPAPIASCATTCVAGERRAKDRHRDRARPSAVLAHSASVSSGQQRSRSIVTGGSNSTAIGGSGSSR